MVQKLTTAEQKSLGEIAGAADAIHNLYILFFNRGAEADGFNYWAKKVLDAKGDTANARIDTIADEFLSDSKAFKGYFEPAKADDKTQSGLSDTAFITKVYANVLGAPATEAQIKTEADKIDGDTSQAEVALGILRTAQAAEGTTAAKTYLANRLAFSQEFAKDTADDKFTGNAVIAPAVRVIAQVQKTAYASPDALAKAAAAGVDSVIAAPSTTTPDSTDSADTTVPGVVGQTYNLTSSNNQQTSGFDTVEGTANNDTIKGVLSQTANLSSFNITDSIDGAAGTDTLQIRVIGDDNSTDDAYNGLTSTAVEVFEASYVDARDGAAADKTTIGTGGFDGLTTLKVDKSTVINTGTNPDDVLKFSAVAADAKLVLGNNSSKLNIEVTNAGEEGAEDSFSIETTGGRNGKVTLNDAAGDGFETVNIATSGAAATIDELAGGTDFKTLNITGAADLTITKNLAAQTIDAEKFSGDLNLSATASNKLKATGGTGTSDVLKLAIGSNVTSGLAVKGFEKVSAHATAAATLDLDLVEGEVALEINDSGETTHVLTLRDATGSTLDFVGSGKADNDQTFNGVTYALKDPGGESDSLAITIGNGGKAAEKTGGTGAITAAGVESVSIATADFEKVTTSITAAQAKTLTLTGSADLTLGTGTSANPSLAKLETLAAGDYTGDTTLSSAIGQAGEDLTATLGAGKDTLTTVAVTTAGKTHSYNTGAGNDTVTLASTTLAAATLGATNIDLGAGNDTVILSLAAGVNYDATDRLSLDGGEGDDTLQVNLDSSVNNDGIDLDNEEFAGFENLTIQGTGAQDVSTIKLNDFSGSLKITAVATYQTAPSDHTFIDFTATANDATISTANVTLLGSLGTNGAIRLTGGTGENTLTGGAAAETLNGGGGDDTLTGGGGNDNFILSAGEDTITDFKTTEDELKISITTVHAANDVTQLIVPIGGANAAVVADAVISDIDADNEDLASATANANILRLSEEVYADTDAVEAAIIASGNRTLVADGALAAGDALLVLYSDGIDSHLAKIVTSAAVLDNQNFAEATTTVTNLVNFTGINLAGVNDLAGADFEIIA